MTNLQIINAMENRYSPEDLDEDIHNAKAVEAVELNNLGVRCQTEALIAAHGPDWVIDTFQLTKTREAVGAKDPSKFYCHLIDTSQETPTHHYVGPFDTEDTAGMFLGLLEYYETAENFTAIVEPGYPVFADIQHWRDFLSQKKNEPTTLTIFRYTTDGGIGPGSFGYVTPPTANHKKVIEHWLNLPSQEEGASPGQKIRDYRFEGFSEQVNAVHYISDGSIVTDIEGNEFIVSIKPHVFKEGE